MAKEPVILSAEAESLFQDKIVFYASERKVELDSDEILTLRKAIKIAWDIYHYGTFLYDDSVMGIAVMVTLVVHAYQGALPYSFVTEFLCKAYRKQILWWNLPLRSQAENRNILVEVVKDNLMGRILRMVSDEKT